MVDLLKANNPNCFVVTGRPRTPRDQGSVENANKLVQRVLKSISAERRLKGLEVNWTNLLGQIMSVCNSQSGTRSHNTSSYEAVFGQRYHPVLMCTLEEMRRCSSIHQRLKLCPDERLVKYVKDCDIIDFDDADGRGRNVETVDEDSDDVDDADDTEGDDIDDNTFPDCEKEDEILCVEITSKIGNTSPNQNNDQLKDTANPFPNQKIMNLDTGYQEEYQAVGPTSESRTYVTLNLRDAWENGKVARSDFPLSHDNEKEFKMLLPTLTCRDCCHVGYDHKQMIMVHDDDYVESIRSSMRWWDGVFIGSFAQMASHYAHVTMNERRTSLDDTPLPQVMHVTYPKEAITESQLMRFPSNVTRLVAVMHESAHYTVLEIDIPSKRIMIFDGLYRDMLEWIDHVVSALKRARLIGVDETCNAIFTGEFIEIEGSGRRGHVKLPHAYILSFDLSPQWRLEVGHFVKQLEGYNCGPIACTKILEVFRLVSEFEVNNAYNLGTIRTLVTEQWKRFLVRCNDDLVVRMKQRRPIGVLREEYASKEKNMTSPADPRPIDPLDICFCFDDEPDMDIVRLVCCCKEFMHRDCLQNWLGFESSCPYCSKPINDIASIQQYPAIDRTKDLPSTPTVTPKPREKGRKRDLQQMEIDDVFGSPTPQRLADKMCSISQEKKRDSQLKQAARMVLTRSNDVEKKGGGIGAVVTVVPDHRAVSHSVGIVGIIYKMKDSGGAQVATVVGLLVQSGKKDWWIPDDQYIVRYPPHMDAAISIDLRKIRESILDGTYNTAKKAKRCTIQEAHKVITNQVSPQKMGKCACLKGKCNPKRCGCATRQRKCTSACTCTGNCTNPQNGK